MATSSLTNQSIESHIVTLFEKLDALRADLPKTRLPMQAEIRTLEFWRSIISECLATFFYVFIVSGACIPWSEHAKQAPSIGIALAAGFTMTTLSNCFGQISGAHVNPAVTLATAVTRKVSPLRAVLYVTAQSGGGIAGAALLFGVTVRGYEGDLGATVVASALSVWQGFAVEFILTFVVVFSYFSAVDPYRKSLGSSAFIVGVAYLACSFVGVPATGASMNPARSLGPAFVMNKWESHWVYWFAPSVGGVMAGLIYEFIFNLHRHSKRRKDSIDGDSSSIHSDEDPYDDIDKTRPKFSSTANYNTIRSQHYNHYRPTISPGGPSNTTSPSGPLSWNQTSNFGTASIYAAPPQRMERTESVYGGTKSLYTKSPPLPRANLNRSQSVYTKVLSNRQESSYENQSGALKASHSVCITKTGGFGNLNRAESIYATKPVAPSVIRTESICGNRTPDGMYGNRSSESSKASEGIYGHKAAEGIYGHKTSEGIYGHKAVEGTYGSKATEGTYGNKTSEGLHGTKALVVQNDSLYGVIQQNAQNRRQDSNDSTYGSYKGNNSYGSNVSRNSGLRIRNDLSSPSYNSAPNSAFSTPNSFVSYHSPNPQY